MERGLVVAPGAFDAFSALLIKEAGFEAIYVGGAWATASAFGRPDVGWMALPELREIVRRIVDVTELPVIVDADSGYGSSIGIYRTVRELQRAGAAALHIEDIREEPEPAGEFYSVREMQGRIHAALDARVSESLVVIARTDTRTKLGLTEAIERARAYSEAGADLVFVNWPKSGEEIEQIARDVERPLLLQISEGARTPKLPFSRLEALGVRVVIFPGGPLRASGMAISRYLNALKAETSPPELLPYDTRSLLTRLDFFMEWQSKYRE